MFLVDFLALSEFLAPIFVALIVSIKGSKSGCFYTLLANSMIDFQIEAADFAIQLDKLNWIEK